MVGLDLCSVVSGDRLPAAAREWWREHPAEVKRLDIASAGWAGVQEPWVREEWRNRGVDRWLVGHLAAWLRLGGADRVAVSVAADDDAAGAGRFYRRCGWEPFVRTIRHWPRAEPPRG